MKRVVILFLFVIVIASCKKNEPQSITSKPLEFIQGHGVFIVNEGNFQQNNASVSYLNLDSLIIHNNIFGSANGITLGDVAQSISLDNNKAYIVLNNSRRIECVSANSFKFIKSIDGFLSPSYLLSVGADKAYVSDSFANKISILNTEGILVSGSIKVNAPTGKMLKADNEVFVTSPGTYNVYVINSETDSLSDSIPVAKGPSDICRDKSGMIWVYCAGDYSNSIHPALYKINPESHNVVNIFSFPSVFSSEGNLCMNAAKDSMYFIHRDVFRMSINDGNLPTNALILAGSKRFYGLTKVPDGRILVSDVKNFTENGTVYIYTANGTLIKGLDASVVPAQMVFY